MIHHIFTEDVVDDDDDGEEDEDDVKDFDDIGEAIAEQVITVPVLFEKCNRQGGSSMKIGTDNPCRSLKISLELT